MSESVAIKIQEVSKSFKLPHEKQSSIKGLFINIFRSKRTYERQQVLKDISFEIDEGEFFGIVGKNGSGKSTLLKLLAGVYSPDRGAIHINGKLTPFIELGVGFNPELTGRENVFLNGALLGFDRSQMNDLYDEIVDFAELANFMDQKLKNYSSGMQVRLAFSIAIQARSDILLLDEVLAVGDAAFQQKCYDYFEELKKAGRTVVFVSHDMGAVTRFCTKAVYVKNGNLVKTGTASEIADYYMEENISKTTRRPSSKEVKPEYSAKLSSKIIGKSEDSVKILFSYDYQDDDDLYLGISVSFKGLSIAELTTDLKRPLRKSGKVTYDLPTGLFNAGNYEVACALFKTENRELVALGRNKSTFNVRGFDITKGAAIKLPDDWSYVE